MYNIKKIITILIILFVACPVLAVEDIEKGAVLGLDECIDIAIKNSPVVNMARNKLIISKAKIGQAKSDYFPTLSAGTGYYGQINSGGNTSGTDDYYSVNTALNQLIYNFGKTNAKINMQKFSEIAAQNDVETSIVDTVFNVKSAYYNVLVAQANRDIQKANVQINERQYIRTKAFFEEGLKSKIDLVNAEVNYSDSKIELVRAENTYQTALIKLNNTMYVAYAPEYSIKNTESFNFNENDYANISILKDDLGKYETIDTINGETVYTSSVEKSEVLKDYTFVPYEYKFEDVLELANEQRPDLKSFLATYSAMQEALKYTKREYFPDLNGKVGYTHRNTNYFVSNGMNFSASLDFPAVNIMNTKHRIDESKAQLDVAMDNVNLAKQNIYFEVQNAYVNLLQIEKRIPLMAVKVRQTLENFELADGRYAVGLGNFIELQDAKNNYNKAQQAYVQTVFDYNIAKATLEKAMGEK